MRIQSFPQLMLVAAAALSLQGLPAHAADTATPPPPPAAMQEGWSGYSEVNWVDHTQRMLADLKTKLNLSGDQQAAWNTWSSGVVDNVRAQTEKIRAWHDAHAKLGPMSDPAHAHLTTPERMSQGLEHMKTEIKRMQDHVALLELALNHTKTFYETLNPDQKTIFDLYWQQSYQGGWIGHSTMEHDSTHDGHMESGHGMGAY